MRKVKTTFLLAVFFLSAIIAPTIGTVNAQEGQGGYNFNSMDNEQVEEAPEQLAKGLGQVFRLMHGMGPSGAALGQVFNLKVKPLRPYQHFLLGGVQRVIIFQGALKKSFMLGMGQSLLNGACP